MKTKPRIGFLGIMQELYDNTLPNITDNQEKYARKVIDHLKEEVEFDFPKAARNRDDLRTGYAYSQGLADEYTPIASGKYSACSGSNDSMEYGRPHV